MFVSNKKKSNCEVLYKNQVHTNKLIITSTQKILILFLAVGTFASDRAGALQADGGSSLADSVRVGQRRHFKVTIKLAF